MFSDLHNLCPVEEKNKTVPYYEPAHDCPGLTTIIFHSDYGSGTLVRYDTKKKAIKASTALRHKPRKVE